MRKTTQAKYPADFLAFYSAYPRSRWQGYVAPYRSWKALINKNALPELSVILAALEQQKQAEQWQKEDGQFVPMMTTWLNQQRWEADIVLPSVEREIAEVANAVKLQIDVNIAWLARKQRNIDKLVYNISKLVPYDTTVLHTIVSYFEHNGVTLYINADPFFSHAYAFADVLNDLVALKFRGQATTLDDANTFLQTYTSTLIAIITCRYCDCDGAEAISGISFSEAECLSLRKILTVLVNPDSCMLYRTKYKVKSFLPVTSWLVAYGVDELLSGLVEIL